MKLLAAEEKITRTNAAARQILNDEASARQKKTARLRQLRLEKELAERNEAAAAPKQVRRTRKQSTKSSAEARY
jgi:hypothetical protein